MLKKFLLLWLMSLAIFVVTVDAATTVTSSPLAFDCGMTESQLIDVPHTTVGRTTIYIGYRQISSTNQDPIIARFDNGVRTWCRTDYETTQVNHQGYGLFWDGGNRLYAVFSTEGARGSFNQDFRRFAVDGWLADYGTGSPARAAVIARIDPVTGDILNATYHSAVLTNGNTNSLSVTDINVLENGNVIVRADSASFPREINRARMVCTGRPYNYTIEFNEDLSLALGAVSTGCTSVSPLPTTARVPGIVTKIAPADGEFFEDNQVSFRWQPAEHAIWYRIYVIDSNGFVIDEWHRASEVCIGAVCLLPARTLMDGRHDWYLMGWGEDGQGPWTTATTFFVGRRPPGIVERIGPQGEVTAVDAALQWNATADAIWYRIYLVGPNNFLMDRWFLSENICMAVVCSLPMTDIFLLNGTYLWWIQAWGEAGLGNWTPTPLEFTLNVPVPAPTVQISPNPDSRIAPGEVIFQWQAEPATTWYRMYVGRSPDLSAAFDQWYDATDICRDGVCVVQTTLMEGIYTWYLSPWGPAGFGPWNEGKVFSVGGTSSDGSIPFEGS